MSAIDQIIHGQSILRLQTNYGVPEMDTGVGERQSEESIAFDALDGN
jgi:hypothetical protein